ncbi:MAG TPA: ABC transporter permease subunit [Verrucomicrobiae bacterium]|jgi:ABC-type transport system involved in cytochrome c biogenesis permease component
MTFLPIVERELRVAARRRGTHSMRFCVALAVLVVWLVLILGSQNSMPPAQLGHQLFMALSIATFGFCLLAGVFLTADCLSSEKREGTLGLLFLTDLKGYDVVLGKLAATSLHAFYGLLATLPVMALPLLMGGVTGGEFGRVSLMLVATLFLSLAVGLAVSAISRESRHAMAGAFCVMALLAGVFPALWWFQKIALRTHLLNYTLLLASPPYGYMKAFDSSYGTASGRLGYWASLGTFVGLGLGLLAMACRLLPRLWQVEGRAWGRGLARQAAPERTSRQSRNEAVDVGNAGVPPAIFGVSPKTFPRPIPALTAAVSDAANQSAGRRLERPGRSRSPFLSALLRLRPVTALWIDGDDRSARLRLRRDPSPAAGLLIDANPFEWLAGRERKPRAVTNLIVGLVAFIWFCFLLATFKRTSRDAAFTICLFSSYGLHVILKCLVAMEASRRFSEDGRSGALELLLVTPLPAESIVLGQWRALKRHFRWPLIAALSVNLGMIWLIVGPDPANMSQWDRGIFTCICLGGILELFLDFRALACVGMWMGARGRKHHRAVLATLGRVMLGPWLGIFLIVFLGFAGAFRSNNSGESIIAIWFFAGIFYSLVVGLSARGRLMSEFRSIATGAETDQRGAVVAPGLEAETAIVQGP